MDPKESQSQDQASATGSLASEHGQGGGGSGRDRGGGRGRSRGRVGRLPRPQRPDDSEAKAMLHALQQALNTHKQRAQELTTLLDKRQADSGARQRAAKLKATQDELGLLRAQLHALAGQEKQAAAQLEEACATARRLKEALRSGVRLANVADIDEQIAELEGRLAGRGLVELERGQEARVRQQIETLRKSRSNVEELRSKASQLAGDSSAMDGLQQSLAAVQESVAAAKAREGELVQALAELKAEEAESQAGIPGLVAERDECRAMCKAAYSRITELRQQQDGVWQEFLSRKEAFQEQQAQAAAAHRARQEQAAEAAAAAAAALAGAGVAKPRQEAHGSVLSQDRPGSGEEEPPLDQQESGSAETAAQQAAALASTAALAGVDRGSSSSTVNEISSPMNSRSSLREGQGAGGNRPGGRDCCRNGRSGSVDEQQLAGEAGASDSP